PHPRQDFRFNTFRGEARLHYRARRPAKYRGPRAENIAGDGAQSVEIHLRQDRHASPKRTRRPASSSRIRGVRGPVDWARLPAPACFGLRANTEASDLAVSDAPLRRSAALRALQRERGYMQN